MMDPTATLARIRHIIESIRESEPEGWFDYGDDLVEAVESLDEWMTTTGGGFPPQQWSARAA